MDDREELARQLHEEHRAGQAADRLEQERRTFRYEIEGWDHDELRVYVPGFGLMVLDEATVAALGRDLLAEHQMRYRKGGR